MVYYIFPHGSKQDGKVYICDSFALYRNNALKCGDIVKSTCFLCNYPKDKILECGAWFKSPPQSSGRMPITTQDMLLVANDLVSIGWPQELNARKTIHDTFLQIRGNGNAHGNIVLGCPFRDMPTSSYPRK